MSEREIIPVIMSGGSGSRLWPLSTSDNPKQFHSLVHGRKTLLQETAVRSQLLPGTTGPMILCNASQVELVTSQLQKIELEPYQIVVEPAARNTAPAIAAAAIVALDSNSETTDDPLLVVLPADHQIEIWDEWCSAVLKAKEAATQGRLVTLGIVPTRPETGYGYIRSGVTHGEWSDVDSFVEKPDYELAQAYIESGDYVWNSGMFVFSAQQIVAELEKYEPALMATVRRSVEASGSDKEVCRLSAAFEECPSISIDYAVMERTNDAAVVTLDAGWSDIGSWDALYELLEKDADGNVVDGSVIMVDSKNCLVRAQSRTIGVVGLENIVVVETRDAVLVMSRDDSQKVRKVVEKL